MTIKRYLFVLLCGALCAPFVTSNAQSAVLNTRVEITGDSITVGDVFTGAENNADHVLGPAPIAGNVILLDTKTLARIADGFGIDWQGRTPTATATIRRADGVRLQTPSERIISVPVLDMPIARDTIITASDIVHIDVPAKSVKGDIVLDKNALIGQAARSLIQAHEPIAMSLLAAPELIKRGDTVTIILKAGRINLTAKGQAMSNARLGDILDLKNTSSDKIVQARVTGVNEAVIEPQT